MTVQKLLQSQGLFFFGNRMKFKNETEQSLEKKRKAAAKPPALQTEKAGTESRKTNGEKTGEKQKKRNGKTAVNGGANRKRTEKKSGLRGGMRRKRPEKAPKPRRETDVPAKEALLEAEELERKKQGLTALVNDPLYKPMKLKELALLLDVPKEKRKELSCVLDLLIAEGKLGISPRGKYARPELYSLCGTYQGSSRGFGFVTAEGREEDIFIPPDKAGEALDGDEVRLVIEKESGGKGRAEGKIIKVLKRANEELVGVYQKSQNFGFVVPDNARITKDIFIPKGKDMGAVNGHKVVVKLTGYGNEKESPQGEIREILGHINDPGVDILSVVKAYGLPEGFPADVLASLSETADEVPEEKAAGRLDLRGERMVTIDGEDAKDLDDAVSLSFDEKTGLFQLGVHIADVSEYVREGSALDAEAKRRGTSVYLVDRVIPMLPHKLSNGICSLNQGEDRLALSCIMWVDKKGHVADHRIAESIIRVDRRMSYTNVNAIITKNDLRKKEQFAEFVPMFFLMKELSGILRARRYQRGGIDFDFPESKITLDQKGRVTKVEAYERNAAHLLIEDFMLLANETVAEDYYWQQIPFLYRTHEAPDPEKIKALSVFVENFGYYMRGGKTDSVHPKAVQALLKKIEGEKEEALIARLALRSMKQAKYTTGCIGHFGLAAKYYTHFTSPIRRYPDLQIHRIIKENLRGGLSAERLSHYEAILPETAERSSKSERRAEEAERECEKMKKCEYMSRFIGEEFDGVISGVTAFGFYVELPNTCEGLVHVNTLTDDYYVFRENTLELCGERTLRSFKLGQPVRITVTAADKLLKTVDFRLAK